MTILLSASSSPKYEEDIISKHFITTSISVDRLKNDISVPSLIALKISSGSSQSFRSLLQQIRKDSNDEETQTAQKQRFHTGGGQTLTLDSILWAFYIESDFVQWYIALPRLHPSRPPIDKSHPLSLCSSVSPGGVLCAEGGCSGEKQAVNKTIKSGTWELTQQVFPQREEWTRAKCSSACNCWISCQNKIKKLFQSFFFVVVVAHLLLTFPPNSRSPSDNFPVFISVWLEKMHEDPCCIYDWLRPFFKYKTRQYYSQNLDQDKTPQQNHKWHVQFNSYKPHSPTGCLYSELNPSLDALFIYCPVFTFSQMAVCLRWFLQQPSVCLSVPTHAAAIYISPTINIRSRGPHSQRLALTH